MGCDEIIALTGERAELCGRLVVHEGKCAAHRVEDPEDIEEERWEDDGGA